MNGLRKGKANLRFVRSVRAHTGINHEKRNKNDI
jgi:hypothetical protein